MPSTQRRCAECKFCTWERVDADGPQWPTCTNSETKNFDPPIFWLHPDSRACQVFESRRTAADRSFPFAVHHQLREIANHRNQRPLGIWNVFGQAVELVAMGVAGAGASNLDQRPGVIAFGMGLSVAVVSLVARMTLRR